MHVVIKGCISQLRVFGSFKNRHLHFDSCGSWTFEIRVLRNWFLVRPLLLACSYPLSPCVPTWPLRYVHVTGRGSEKQAPVSLVIRPLFLSDQGSTIMTTFNLSYLLKYPTSNIVTRGIRAPA